MADLRERYLRQQAELGGAELVLSRPLDARKPAPAASEPAVPAESREPASGTSPVSPRTAGDWRRGAPPIPGPGLSVTPPEVPLVGDPLNGLESLEAVAERIRSTHCCGLCAGRRNAVPGEGNPRARLVLVGEGPGATEDETGRPFVGQAGRLLDDILAAVELTRDEVFICNVVKCRPPQNRKPLPEEMAACLPYLHRQLALIRPAVILALGSTAAAGLLGTREPLTRLRGKVHHYGGIPLLVTYHPAALLRNPNWKKPAWDDVRIARQLLDR